MINHHAGFDHAWGIDDLGQVLVSGGPTDYLLVPATAASPKGPMERPKVPARFVFFRENQTSRSLTNLGLPGALRLARFLESRFGKGKVEPAFDPAHVRIGAGMTDPIVIVDDTGITTPQYGYMPWDWIEGVLAINLDGFFGLTIHLNQSPEWHNRFPIAKAFVISLERNVVGGRIDEGRYEQVPLEVLYPQIEVFVHQFVPKPDELPGP